MIRLKVVFCLLALFCLANCTSTSSPGSSMSPVQGVGCDVETAVTTAFASAVSASFSCTNESAIQTSLQVALGNVNLCSGGTAGVTAAQMKAKKAQTVKAMGVVGAVVCPLAINTILGFASSQIPVTWGCSASPQASSVASALTAACIAAVPL